MMSPATAARLGLGTASFLCAVNLTLLGSAAWDARGVQRGPSDRSLAENTRAASSDRSARPPQVLGVTEQRGALASRQR